MPIVKITDTMPIDAMYSRSETFRIDPGTHSLGLILILREAT